MWRPPVLTNKNPSQSIYNEKISYFYCHTTRVIAYVGTRMAFRL